MVKVLIAVLLMAVVTYIIRVLPLAFFRSQLRSRFLRSFLYYVPYAVLGAMTFPAILYSTGNLYSAWIGMGVALVMAFFESGLLRVALGAIVSVFLAEWVIRLISL